MNTVGYDHRAMTAKERAFQRALAQRQEADNWTLGLGRACLMVGLVCAAIVWVLL